MISRYALDKNPMPGHLFEGNPVDEGTTQRGTDTLVHRPEKPAGSTYSSTSGLSPLKNSRGKWGFIPLHKTMPDSPVTTLGTLRTESEMERKPEVPASTQDEAFSIAAKPEESREARPKSTVCLTSQRHPEKLPKVTGRSRRNPGFPAPT